MRCTCLWEASHTAIHFHPIEETQQRLRRNIDRSSYIGGDSLFRFEQQFLQFLGHQEHDENALRIERVLTGCLSRTEVRPEKTELLHKSLDLKFGKKSR